MRQLRRDVCLAAAAVSSLFLVHASAQEPPPPIDPPMNMTGCITRDGDSKNWNFGLTPLRPCSRNESQVTFVLQAAVDALAAAGSAANGVLQANIDSEAAARSAADATLTASVAAEAASRTTADSGLQQQITSNAGAISANAASIAAVENEIGDKVNDYANSRIDASSVASAGIVGVIWSDEGGIEDTSGHYRTLIWNSATGQLALRAEINHGLDYVPNTGYWYCTIGQQIANGDIQEQVETAPDDHAALAAVGLGEYASAWWSFKLENTQGPNGKSAFAKIQVWNADDHRYVTVVPTDDYPVTGWLMGRRSTTLGQTGALRVALSDSQLRALIANRYGNFTFGTADNHVLVDLNYSVADLR